MDGNNSLKRLFKIGGRDPTNLREFLGSDYYLTAEFVDRFKDEVKSHQSQKNPQPAESAEDGDSDWTDDEDAEGTPADVQDDRHKNCTKNWKAAADDAKKKMWAIFEETGIFACACRHGLVLWIIDMIRSGELCVDSFVPSSHRLSSANVSI